MQIFTTVNITTQRTTKERANERGAALLTALLFSVLLLAAGGALIMTTALSATNAFDATAETQAYHAAEAGMQATLAVLRGNVAPNPLFNTSSSTAPENKISFRKAVTLSDSNKSGDAATTSNVARLSRWLTYDALTYSATALAGRAELSSPYSSISGMAYDTKVRDPDNTGTVSFSTSGIFPTSTLSPQTSIKFGGGSDTATITYAPQSSTTITNSGNSTLGSFQISAVNGITVIPAGTTFNLTINQTAPFAGTLTISCTIDGTITKATSTSTVNLHISPKPQQTTAPLTNSIGGVVYARTLNDFPIAYSGTTTIPASVTAPEPKRLLVEVTGYGPRGARKQMQMLVSRFAFDYSAPSTITLRSADDNTQLSYNAGSSQPYVYSGYDNAGGSNLSAFGVTSTTDYSYLSGLTFSGKVVGVPAPVQKIAIPDLPTWLQTADAARELISQMRTYAQNENRYFTGSPSGYGTVTQPLLTFVEGDADLPPAGGAGLLIVTGTLTAKGSADFKGLILVLGEGHLDRSGGGNGDSLGSVAIARFGATGNFLPPTFDTNGAGTGAVTYDSDWIRRALASAGPRVVGVSEY